MRHSALLLCVLAATSLLPAAAGAAGPVVSGGVIGTHLADGGDARYQGLTGGAYKIAFEIGTNRFRSEWGFNQGFLKGNGGGAPHDLRLTGFSYQLTFHLFKGFISPYLGAGIEMGTAIMKEQGWSYDSSLASVKNGAYLRPYAILGLRLQFGMGLGLRAELTASSYGEFISYAHNLGLSYTW